MTDPTEVTMQNLFDAITDAIIQGEDYRVNRLIRRADVVSAETDDLLSVVKGLNKTLVAAQPSDRFMRHLKRDLLDEPQGWLARLSSTPGRVRVATGAAAMLASLMWFIRRKERPASDDVEQPALQQGS